MLVLVKVLPLPGFINVTTGAATPVTLKKNNGDVLVFCASSTQVTVQLCVVFTILFTVVVVEVPFADAIFVTFAASSRFSVQVKLVSILSITVQLNVTVLFSLVLLAGEFNVIFGAVLSMVST